MRFKPHQKLVCVINTDHWIQETGLSWLQYLRLKSRKVKGPKFNEIVTVDIRGHEPGGIALKEYNTYSNGERNTFHEIFFEPLISDNVLEMELASCREPDFT